MAKEKKLEHIQAKDNGIKTANKVGDTLNEAKQLLTKNIFEGLLTGSNETNLVRYKVAQNIALKAFEVNSSKIIQKAETMAKNTLKNSDVNLKPNQVSSMTHDIKKGLLFLQEDAVGSYKKTLQDVLLKVKSADNLKEQLAKHIESGLNIGVVYENKREYKFDSYFEMKARTEIQRDIGSNMVQAGQDAGVVFYISAYFGDCAPDHAELNGKLFCDEKWETLAPKDRVEEVRSYIESNKIMTVQEAMGAPYYYTTRPNCRHYFQYISIDEVLGAKTPEEVKKLRDEKSLNFNGKYKPDKYKALQQQRLNERKIRAYKEEVVKAEQVLKLEPNDKVLKVKKETALMNIRNTQKAQRELEKHYANIERRYDRESLTNRVDFEGGTTKLKFKYTDSDNDRLIGRKRVGLSKKPFDYIVKRSQAMLTKKKDDVRITIEAKSDPRLYYENCLVRKYYHEQLSKISGLVSKGKTIEEQALIAFNARNDIRLDARSKMVDLKALSLLPESKSFEELITSKMQRKGMTREEALKDIIRTSSTSNGEFDALFKEDD